MRDVTCCFTGHRSIPKVDRCHISVATEVAIRSLIINHGVRYFGVGGALGYDSLTADILFRLRSSAFPQIKVILVYPFEGFIDRWSVEQQQRHTDRLPLYDKRVCVSQTASREAYLARNRHLVDHSAHCIAYCTRDTGGTAYTLGYAKEKKLNIVNVANERKGHI